MWKMKWCYGIESGALWQCNVNVASSNSAYFTSCKRHLLLADIPVFSCLKVQMNLHNFVSSFACYIAHILFHWRLIALKMVIIAPLPHRPPPTKPFYFVEALAWHANGRVIIIIVVTFKHIT